MPANTLPGSKTVVELGQVVRADRDAGLARAVPPRRAFRRDGHGRTRRRVRGADLRHARGGQGGRAARLGQAAEARRSASAASPRTNRKPTLLWDGEWEITYVTFRDMGAAFMVAMLGIYVLVVAQFRSFKLPLVILTPIPLTLIGIVLGHWLFDAPFTATSMIGFIALAGIIVRNSILLVDFIRHGAGQRQDLARGAAERRRDPLQADPAHRAVGDDRRGDDPDRPDLPGPGDLAAVRARVIDAADRAGDPRDLRGIP